MEQAYCMRMFIQICWGGECLDLNSTHLSTSKHNGFGHGIKFICTWKLGKSISGTIKLMITYIIYYNTRTILLLTKFQRQAIQILIDN